MQQGSEPAAPQVLDVERPVFYTVTETSEILRLDESTLYRHLRNGTFPGVKIGGRYVVPHAVLEQLISDVLVTGRRVDLGKWTERWRAEQDAAAQRCDSSQPASSLRFDRGEVAAAGASRTAALAYLDRSEGGERSCR